MRIKQGIIQSVLCGALLAFVPAASAIPNLSLFDGNELGFVNYGIPAGDADVTAYVNAMIGLGLGGSTVVTRSGIDNTVTRSSNVFSPLDSAVLASRATYGDISGSTVTINLGAGGYEYLLAKYDGPNYGSEVWYVGGLTGDITIPSKASKYGISGTSLFTPTGVPDGGMTAIMLGAALSGLGLVRRRIKN